MSAPAESEVDASDVFFSAEVIQIEGLYRTVLDVALFHACGTPADSSLLYEVLRTPALDAAYQRTIVQGFEGQSVVAKLTGRVEIVPAVEISGNGESPPTPRFKVESIDTMMAKNPRNVCVPYTFWGLGNEPFWGLLISRDEAVAEWSMLGENTVRYEYADPTSEMGGKVQRYVFPGEQRMKVTVTQELCIDDMSGNRLPYTIAVERAGKTYKGCAHDYTSAQ